MRHNSSPCTTLNYGSGWCTSCCYVNSGWAWVEVCWILHFAASDTDSHKVCFLLFGEVQAPAGKLCVDHEVREGTPKYIGKKHCTLWNIHKYRDEILEIILTQITL